MYDEARLEGERQEQLDLERQQLGECGIKPINLKQIEVDIRGDGIRTVHNIDTQENNKIERFGDQEGNETILINPHEEAPLLGKRKKKNNKERAAQREEKKTQGEQLTLDERRAEQEAKIIQQFKTYKHMLAKTEDWLYTL